MHTIESVRAIIATEWENEEPETIADILQREEGKALTVHVLKKFPGGPERWRICKQYGMTHIEEKGYGDGNARRFLICHREVNVFIPSRAELRRLNPAYFTGREERNAKRLIAQNDPKRLAAMANALNNLQAAKEALKKAQTAFDELTDYGEPFNPERYTLRNLVWTDNDKDKWA